MKYYRVQPKDTPKPQGKVPAFTGKEYILAHILGWYGDEYDVWELRGNAQKPHTEDVQLFLDETAADFGKPTFTHLTVHVVELTVTNAYKIGCVGMKRNVQGNVLTISIDLE